MSCAHVLFPTPDGDDELAELTVGRGALVASPTLAAGLLGFLILHAPPLLRRPPRRVRSLARGASALLLGAQSLLVWRIRQVRMCEGDDALALPWFVVLAALLAGAHVTIFLWAYRALPRTSCVALWAESGLCVALDWALRGPYASAAARAVLPLQLFSASQFMLQTLFLVAPRRGGGVRRIVAVDPTARRPVAGAAAP